MTKDSIIEKFEGSKEQIKHSTILGWLRSLPSTSSKVKPNKIKIGDVFFHSVFNHPYLILKLNKDGFICTILTTEENCNEILVKANSRFFYDSYITKVLFLVTNETIKNDKFYGVYENNSQIKRILKDLQNLFVLQ